MGVHDALGRGARWEALRPAKAEWNLERHGKREEIAMKTTGHGIEESRDVDTSTTCGLWCC